MAKAAFLVPINEGMEAEVRELAAMVQGDLRRQNADVLKGLGIESQVVWLGHSHDRWFLVSVLEGDDPVASVTAFLELQEPAVGIWLKNTVINLGDFHEAIWNPMELLLDSKVD